LTPVRGSLKGAKPPFPIIYCNLPLSPRERGTNGVRTSEKRFLFLVNIGLLHKEKTVNPNVRFAPFKADVILLSAFSPNLPVFRIV
jgi:hypothetical protein